MLTFFFDWAEVLHNFRLSRWEENGYHILTIAYLVYRVKQAHFYKFYACKI